VLDRVHLGLVAKMPLAGEIGGVPVLLEELGDGRRFLLEPVLVAGTDDDRQRRADRDATGLKRGTTSGAARLPVPAGEQHTFPGEAIDVGRRMAEGASTTGIGAKITPAEVVAHNYYDVGSFLLLRFC